MASSQTSIENRFGFNKQNQVPMFLPVQQTLTNSPCMYAGRRQVRG